MLKYNISRIISIRGIERPFSFLVKNGFTYNAAHKITNNKIDRLPIKHIEKLCLLFNCTPNDLLEWTPDTNTNINNDHPINQLIRKNRESKYKNIYRELPIDKLDKLDELLSKLDDTTIDPE